MRFVHVAVHVVLLDFRKGTGEVIRLSRTTAGVKQPPLEHLIDDKTFVIFSHTIKAQPENMPLLDAILQKVLSLSLSLSLSLLRHATIES